MSDDNKQDLVFKIKFINFDRKIRKKGPSCLVDIGLQNG